MSAFDSTLDFNLGTPKADQPKYVQLREYVVSKIESGEFKAGSALPSEVRISELLQVARSTVRQALSELERDGLVRRVHGKGTFVQGQAPKKLKRTQDIFALIMPEAGHGYYPSLHKSFEDAASEQHSQVIVCNSGNNVDRQGNSILQLIDMQVAGVAIIPTTAPLTPAFQLRQLQVRGIPVVCCSRSVEGIQAPLLQNPYEDIGRLGGEQIVNWGHKQIGFFSGSGMQAREQFERGLRSATRGKAEIQVSYGDFLLNRSEEHEERILSDLDNMLSSEQPPTAIFATFDSIAEMIYLALTRKGIRIPEDISLLGFGGTQRVGALANRLTSITLDEIYLGQEAINLLNRMRNGELPIESQELRLLPIGVSNGKTLSAPSSVTVEGNA